LWIGSFLDGEGTYTLHGVKTSDLFYVICDKSCFIRADLFLSLNLLGSQFLERSYLLGRTPAW